MLLVAERNAAIGDGVSGTAMDGDGVSNASVSAEAVHGVVTGPGSRI